MEYIGATVNTRSKKHQQIILILIFTKLGEAERLEART